MGLSRLFSMGDMQASRPQWDRMLAEVSSHTQTSTGNSSVSEIADAFFNSIQNSSASMKQFGKSLNSVMNMALGTILTLLFIGTLLSA